MTDHSNLTSAGVLPHWVLDNLLPATVNAGGQEMSAASRAKTADIYAIMDLWTSPGPDTISPPTETTFKTNLRVWRFPNAATKFLHYSQQLPHGYKQDSTIRFHIHFMTDTNVTDGQTVIFTMNYSIGSPWARMGAEQTLAAMTFTNNAATRAIIAGIDAGALSGTTILAGTHLMTSSEVLTLPSVVLGSAAVVGRIYRSTSDTYGGNVDFLFADSHIRIDRFGSATEDPRT